MKYPFKKESDYGHDILILDWLVDSLMEDRDYPRTEILTKMILIKTIVVSINKSIVGRDADLYFRYDNQECDDNGS